MQSSNPLKPNLVTKLLFYLTDSFCIARIYKFATILIDDDG